MITNFMLYKYKECYSNVPSAGVLPRSTHDFTRMIIQES